jgi:hypothetical protein
MKAVLFQKSNKKIVEVVDNVNDYDKDDISGDARIQGLSPNIDWKLLDDSINIPYKIIDGIKVYDDIDLNQFKNKKPEADKQKALSTIRTKRDELLDQADIKYCNSEKWESMTPEKKQEWKDYKKALKDFPSHCDPFNPVWPVKPV